MVRFPAIAALAALCLSSAVPALAADPDLPSRIDLGRAGSRMAADARPVATDLSDCTPNVDAGRGWVRSVDDDGGCGRVFPLPTLEEIAVTMSHAAEPGDAGLLIGTDRGRDSDAADWATAADGWARFYVPGTVSPDAP